MVNLNEERGSTLVLVLVFLVVFSGLAVVYFSVFSSGFQQAERRESEVYAYHQARAGAEAALKLLERDDPQYYLKQDRMTKT